jgi:hypothetical protein
VLAELWPCFFIKERSLLFEKYAAINAIMLAWPRQTLLV